MALAAHYRLTRALSNADASVVMPMDYLRLPLMMVVGGWLYGEGVTAVGICADHRWQRLGSLSSDAPVRADIKMKQEVASRYAMLAYLNQVRLLRAPAFS
jgi:hypothetical protein